MEILLPPFKNSTASAKISLGMNANKALELGFCDEIMFRREEAEADAEDSFLYSSRAVTNCLLNKLKAHAPKPEPRVKASDLEKRLALL